MKPLQRAAIHFQRGEYEHVERICGKVLVSDPDDTRAWQMRGLAALHLKQYESAAAHLREAAARQETPQTLVNLGVSLLALNRPQEAVRPLKRALELDPANAGAELNIAACYLREHRLEEAEAAVTRSLALDPSSAKAVYMQARIALKRGEVERAWDLASAALASDPTLSVSHRVLADVAMRRLDYGMAADHFRLSLKDNPDDPETHGNFALLLARTGAYEQSAMWYRRAAAVLHDDPNVQHGLADVLLIQGHFSEGWPLYGWRHFMRDENLPLVDQAFPAGLPEGETAVAVLDQGLGDQVMMASMIPDLAARVPRLEVQCHPRLQSLFQRSFPEVSFTPYILKSMPEAKAAPGSFGLADVGAWLRPNFESFPRHAGYLRPDEGLKAALRARYVKKAGPVVGISWATRRAIKLAPHKSVPLAAWGPLLSIPGISFVNLQYDCDPTEIADAEKRFGARITSDPAIDPAGDLDRFAAQVAAMDLVISTSSSAAHFAGALNVPAWVFVPTGIGGLWHWFLDREDSPWYPSVRIFRQPKRGDWNEVLDRASMALVAFVEEWSKRNP